MKIHLPYHLKRSKNKSYPKQEGAKDQHPLRTKRLRYLNVNLWSLAQKLCFSDTGKVTGVEGHELHLIC